jgi:ribonuclease HI
VEKQLLQYSEYLVPFDEIVEVLQHNSLSVSDGSVKDKQGTFGRVTAMANGKRMINTSGPAFGSPMDSYRAEAYGVLSSLVFIHRLSEYTNQSVTSAIKLYTDNMGVIITEVQIMRKRKGPEFPNATLLSSWDVLQQIVQVLRSLPTVTLHHVPGHQDKHKAWEELSLPEQLNVEADKLAGLFQNQSNHKDKMVPLIQGSRIQFHIQGITVVSNIRQSAMAVYKKSQLEARLCKQLQIDQDIFQNINWEAHGWATNLSKVLRNFCFSFFMECYQ